MIEAALADAMRELRPFSFTHRMLVGGSGEERVLECHGEVFADDAGEPVRLLGTARDITVQHQALRELAYLAEHDPLTGIANRRRITAQLAECGVRPGGAALLLIDIDNFKDVNDLHGHATGDRVIRSVAASMAAEIGSEGMLGRLGGDEFAVVLPGGDADDGMTLAKRLCAAVATAPMAEIGALRITVSIGVAVALDDDVEAGLAQADLALYAAKSAGRNRARLFDSDQYDQAVRRVTLLRRVRTALDQDTMQLDAQPIVDLTTGRTTRYELLIRLRDGNYPLLGPVDFLPAAERTDLVLRLDRWVLERAIRTLATPRAREVGLRLEVNVSARSLEDAELGGWILSGLAEAQVEPQRLGLEITETTAIGSLAAARALATRLTEAGCGFTLDDFGAGFGSFSYLKYLPFTSVKIAGEFVRQLDRDPVDRALVAGAGRRGQAAQHAHGGRAGRPGPADRPAAGGRGRRRAGLPPRTAAPAEPLRTRPDPRCAADRPARPPYAARMSRVVEVEAARRLFLATGQDVSVMVRDVLRPEVAASWQRSRQHRVDPDRITARFLGHHQQLPLVVSCADDVFGQFLAANPDAGCSLVLFDSSGVVRARRDADAALARLLDGLALVPGYGYAERTVGSTAASIALHEQADFALSGAEHYHAQLMCVAEAAALLPDPHGGEPAGVITVLCHDSDRSALQLPLARMLADRVADRMAGEPHRRAQAILQHFSHRDRGHPDGEWALATDGDYVLSNGVARRLDPADQRALADLVLSSLVLHDFGYQHLDLPAAGCAEAVVEAVHLGGELIGCVLTGAPSAGRRAAPPEAVRRQGSHVAPLTRRDYAEDLRPASTAHEHAEARVRANRELLSPFLRARQEVVASIRQGRNHLLIGEPGVGQAFAAGRPVPGGLPVRADRDRGLRVVRIGGRPPARSCRAAPTGARSCCCCAG